MDQQTCCDAICVPFSRLQTLLGGCLGSMTFVRQTGLQESKSGLPQLTFLESLTFEANLKTSLGFRGKC